MNSDPQFRQFINLVRRRKWLILGVAVLGSALAATGAMFLPSRYTGKVQLVFEPQQAAARAPEIPPILNQAAEDAMIQTQVATLLSFDQREKVRLSLPDDEAYRAAVQKQREEAEQRTQAWRAALNDLPYGLGAWIPKPTPPAEAADAPQPPDQETFERRLKVFQEAGSHVIAATYSGDTPALAAAIANRVAKFYIDQSTEEKRAASTRELAWLGSRIPALQAEMDRSEAAVREYEAAHGYQEVTPSLTGDQQVADLSRQLAQAEADAAASESRLAFVRDRLRGGRAAPVPQELSSPVLDELQRQEAALTQSEAELATTVGEMHPSSQQVRNKLRDVRARIAQEAERATGHVANEVAIARAQVATLRTRLAQVNQARADVRLRDLEHDVTVKRQLLTALVQRREEVRGQQDILRPDARILSAAYPPARPSSPNPLLFVFPAGVVFLIGGGMLAVLLERLDRKLRSQDDVAMALGIPCLALVPQIRGVRRRRPHHYLLAKPLAAYTEAIRSVVAALQIGGLRCKTVLVSSSVPGEGKTTIAVSLAAYMASLGRRVLLVDLDFRHSTILRELGGEAGGGVLDLIVSDRPTTEVIQHLPGLRLDYLPVSQRPQDPFALFASDRMAATLRQLSEQYECVIVDGPPLLAITEARVLATMVDKLLFVVKWGSTRRDVAENALKTLRGLGHSTIAGAVLTQVDLKKHARGGYGDVAESFVRYRKYYLEG